MNSASRSTLAASVALLPAIALAQDARNQKLSLRRADAVKKYLTARSIAPNRVYADGKGKTQALTKPADCKGKKGKGLIACYQPHRRVDVEATGTKTK